jgi:drug/metabolite transporter (DMT)-like permease
LSTAVNTRARVREEHFDVGAEAGAREAQASGGAAEEEALHRQERLGLLFATLCVLNGAFVPAVAKLTTERADALFVATLTTLFGGVFAGFVLGARGEWRLLVEPGRRFHLALVGAFGTALAFFLFFHGAQRSSAIDAVLCLQIEPLYSLLAAWAVLGHRPSWRRLVALAVLLAGIALAVAGPSYAPSPGTWLLLATPLSWQLSHLVALRRLESVPPQVLAGARYVYGGAMLALLWLIGGGLETAPARDTLAGLLPLLALQGCVLSYLGTLLWYQTIRRLDLGRATSIVVPSIPVLSLGASFALLGEVPTPRQWLGLALVVVGVFAFVTAPRAVARERHRRFLERERLARS